jgi:hypothetical protein
MCQRAPLPRAQTQVGGLDATIQVVIAGPYFLSELLPVDVSLTNHTQALVRLLGLNTTPLRCDDAALMVRLTNGSDSSFAFPSLFAAPPHGRSGSAPTRVTPLAIAWCSPARR